MSKQKEGVYEKIIEIAKQEFLKNGFKDASLRIIAKKAETSTSSIYTRFKDKEGLFDAIVTPIAKEFAQIFINMQDTFQKFDPEVQKDTVYEYSYDCQDALIDYVYNHFEEFKLLLTCSYGTQNADFLQKLIDIETKNSIVFIETIQSDAIASGAITEEFLHIINTAYLSGFFEVVLHDMKKEEAIHYIQQLGRFYTSGYNSIYQLNK